MAQLRQDEESFAKRNVAVLIIGPDGPRAFKRFWEEQNMPFIGLADIGSKVSDLYQQEVNILKLGRMPAVFVVDEEGKIRFIHYAQHMADIPSNAQILAVLDSW
jgi:peroxiredoxin Q/BCP